MRNFSAAGLAAVVTFLFPGVGSAGALFEGAEFQANTYTTYSQYGPTARSVARAPDGSFVVVWQSYGQDGGLTGIHGQRFDSAGAPAGTEFQVNTYTTSFQTSPAVSQAGDGSFVVVWDSYGQDGSGYGIHGQRFDSAGAPAGTEFPVNTYTTSNQARPVLAQAIDGSFVVVWASDGQDASGSSVQGRRFDSAGAAAGTEFQVNTYTTSSQYSQAVSCAIDGSFVVVWASYGPDGDGFSIEGRRFDAAGAPVGTEFQVNTYTTSSQLSPAVSMASDGSFVVAWESSGPDGSSLSVQGQRFDGAGAPAGTEFQVNTYTTSYQSRPAVSQVGDGFVVVWHSDGQDGSGLSVQGQRFDGTGAAAGTEFQVNTYATSSQRYPSIAADVAGDFVVVWASDGQDGYGYGMFGQRLCDDANSNLMCDSVETTTTSTTTMSTTTSTTTTTVPASDCGPAPAGGCLGGARASLQVRDTDDAKDQIKWKLKKGDAFDQMSLGDPVGSRTYTLCIYDETAAVPALVTWLTIPPNVNWTSKDPKGFSYKDSSGAEDGVTRAALKTGAATKSSVAVLAKGLNIPMPVPFSETELFDRDAAVTVQLVNDETSTCWTSEFTTAKTNTAGQFKASTP